MFGPETLPSATPAGHPGPWALPRYVKTALFHFPAALLPVTFAGQRLLDPFLLTRLQVIGVSLDFLDNVLLLDLTLEAAKGVFQCFTLLKLYFCQKKCTSLLSTDLPCRTYLRPSQGTDIILGCTPKSSPIFENSFAFRLLPANH